MLGALAIIFVSYDSFCHDHVLEFDKIVVLSILLCCLQYQVAHIEIMQRTLMKWYELSTKQSVFLKEKFK